VTQSSHPTPAPAAGRTYCGSLRSPDIGRTVVLRGWVAHRREHGEHLAFIDLRDWTGLVQVVVDEAAELRIESVVEVQGEVRARPEGTENPMLATGRVEVAAATVTILGPAEPLPIPLDDRAEVDEALRLRYRYLDLRRARMQSNLRKRAGILSAIRRSLEEDGFLEVETPLLWTPTPEGAREFAVPSRLQPGNFYVLPQSPQIAKQLLMVAGCDRYYQVARCLRDEDLRADRQFEFTQVDLEASFTSQAEVRAVVSRAIAAAVGALSKTAEPGEGMIEPPPVIEVLTWREAMDSYGSDKPDLRLSERIVDLGPVLSATEVRAFAGAEAIKGLRVPGGASFTRSRLDRLVERAQELGAKGLVWARVKPGAELESPISRFLSAAEQAGIVAALAGEPGDLALVVAGDWLTTCQVLGGLRREVLEVEEPGSHRFCWVTEFPLFEGLDEAGRPIPAHHPFTMFHEEDAERLETDPLSVRSQSYDLVVDGVELGSGSIRIHRLDLQARIFALLGLTEAEAEERFGFLLSAFRYGAPPHGGFAIGLDRLVAVLCGESSIREVIAFPKTQSGGDPMTGAPKPIAPSQLRELRLAPVKLADRG
jgi:aspartyl-tRNA synthetase